MIRTRPDLRWCSDLNVTAALELAHGKTVLVPFAEDNLVFDQVAVAAPRAMEAYANAYATFRDEVERNRRVLCTPNGRGGRSSLYPRDGPASLL